MLVLRLAVMALGLVLGLNQAHADIVILKDGQRFEGAVDKRDGKVHLTLDIGVISFAETDVLRIERSTSALHEFDQLFETLPPGDIQAVQDLALWATRQGLTARADSLHGLVIAWSPDNAISRRALGHYQKEGQWFDPAVEAQAARRQDYRARAEKLRAEEAAAKQSAAQQRQRREELALVKALLARAERRDAPSDRGASWATAYPFHWVFAQGVPFGIGSGRRSLGRRKNLIPWHRGRHRAAKPSRKRSAGGRIRSHRAARITRRGLAGSR